MTRHLTDAEREDLHRSLADHAADRVASNTDPDGTWLLLASVLALATEGRKLPEGFSVRTYR